MRTSSKGSETFDSDGDGSYDVSFFASSVSHSIDVSKRIFAMFGDGTYSEASTKWIKASEEERKAFLLEHHEAAHHGLLFSTPVGALLWRINQVLSRDIRYLSKELEALGILVPANKTPRKWLANDDFSTRLRTHDWAAPEHKLCIFGVIEAIEKNLQFREIFFEKGAPSKYAELTVGELLDLCNFVYPYLARRCAVRPPGKCTSRLKNLNVKVFPPEMAFNVLDIGECHAIAKELSLLRAVRDMDGLKARLDEATTGEFRVCLRRIIAITSTPNEIGFTPHMVQIAALLACSGTIDILQKEALDVCIEDHLPWWRFSQETINTVESHLRSIEGLTALHSQALIGSRSQWIRFNTTEDSQSVINFVADLASFGLDLQIALIHRGAYQNLVFLIESIKNSENNQQFDEALNQWNRFLFLNKSFIEYSDNLFLSYIDLDEFYTVSHPLREMPVFDRLHWPHNQLLAHIVNGALTRRAIATYQHILIPTSAIITDKLESFIADSYEEFPELAEPQRASLLHMLRSTMVEIFGKGRDLPFGVEHRRESSRGNRFI